MKQTKHDCIMLAGVIHVTCIGPMDSIWVIRGFLWDLYGIRLRTNDENDYSQENLTGSNEDVTRKKEMITREK